MPTGAVLASKGGGELTRDEAEPVLLGSCGKMRACGAGTSFYSSVTVVLFLGATAPRV